VITTTIMFELFNNLTASVTPGKIFTELAEVSEFGRPKTTLLAIRTPSRSRKAARLIYFPLTIWLHCSLVLGEKPINAK
jgi:hypothetical protein